MNFNLKARPGFTSVFNGAIGQVLQNGKGKEYFRRSPGVRLIIPTETGLVIQREKRSYLDREWDYRVPGGKVADTLKEYIELIHEQFPFIHIQRAGRDEAKQEAGIIINKMAEYHQSESSATVEHDLFYFLVSDFKWGKQELQHEEVIEVVELPYKEVWDLLLERKFSEDRTRAVLFEYLIKEKSSFLV